MEYNLGKFTTDFALRTECNLEIIESIYINTYYRYYIVISDSMH